MIWLDALVAATLVGVGWASLNSRDLFRSAVLFIALGATLALAWVRLSAPDVALAEVALGAGLTGALLLRSVAAGSGDETQPRASLRVFRDVGFVLSVGLAVVSIRALASLPAEAPNLRDAVAREIEGSGASNPVTAVLLNYRAWDTLLEITVLVAALAGTWMLGARHAPRRERAADPVLQTFARILVPLSCVVAGYLLWKGTSAPGGAFQAGSVLAGAGVIAVLSGHASPERWRRALTRSALALGPGVFLLAGVVGWVARGALLAFVPEHASTWILLIESAAMLSIAAALLGLFLAVSRDRFAAPGGSR